MPAGWVGNPDAAFINTDDRWFSRNLEETPQLWLLVVGTKSGRTLTQHGTASANFADDQRAGILRIARRMRCRRDLQAFDSPAGSPSRHLPIAGRRQNHLLAIPLARSSR